jgi:hypothetical protein
MGATELVHHAQIIAQENACQDILGQYESNVGVHHLAGTPHVAEDLPITVTDKTVAYPGRSSLSLCSAKKKGPKISEHDKAPQTSPLHYLFRFLEWREGFLITIFCSHDDYPPRYAKLCFITEYPSPKVIFISFHV